MRLKEALTTLNGLIEKKSRFSGTALAIPLARNRRELEALREGYDDMLAPSAEIKEFQGKRQELVEKYGVQKEIDKKILWIVEDDEKLKSFKKDLTDLAEEFKEAIKAYDVQIEKANEALKKDIEVTLHKIKLKDLPKDLNDEEAYILLPFLE